MDASVLVVYETRFRPDLPHSPRWLDHQRGKIHRGLSAFEASPPDPNKTDVVSIGLSCALGYLDWRKQVDWRPAYPALVDWLDAVFRTRAGIRAHARQRSVMEHNADTAADAPYWMATPSKPKLKLPRRRLRCSCACFRSAYTFSLRGRTKLHALRCDERVAVCTARAAWHSALRDRSTGLPRHSTIRSPLMQPRATGKAYKGVGLVPLTISDAELKRLDAAGLCGARFHYMAHLGQRARNQRGRGICQAACRFWLASADPHRSRLIAELTPTLRRSPVPVVIDHMGRLDASLGLDQPHFKALLALLDDKKVWVKVSGSDRVTAGARLMATPCRSRGNWWQSLATAASGAPTGLIRTIKDQFPTTASWSTSSQTSPRLKQRDRRCLSIIRSASTVSLRRADLREQHHERTPAGPSRDRNRRWLRRPGLGQRPRNSRTFRRGRRENFCRRSRPR